MTVQSTRSRLLPWFVVGFGFLALAFAFSARATLGLVMPVWESELDWSRTFVSGTGAAALIVMACVAPFAGRLVDRHGPRLALALGLATVGLGSIAIAITKSRFGFVMAFGGISAIGYGIIATHVVSTAVAQNIRRNLGLAIGIATSGATAGQFLIVPLIASVLVFANWRWSFAAIGVACLALIPALWWLLADQGHSDRPAEYKPVEATSLRADAVYLLRKPAFHILFWSFLLCGYTTTGVIETHFLPYAHDHGFEPLPSATAYGVLSAVNMLGMILAGWLSDRMNRPLLLGSIYLARAFTFVLLINVGADYNALLIFTALFGVVDYSTVPVTASLAASHLGLRVMGLAMGMISAGHSIGGALGAFFGGYIFELYAKYDWLWLSSIGLAALAGLMAFALRDQPAPPQAPALLRSGSR